MISLGFQREMRMMALGLFFCQLLIFIVAVNNKTESLHSISVLIVQFSSSILGFLKVNTCCWNIPCKVLYIIKPSIFIPRVPFMLCKICLILLHPVDHLRVVLSLRAISTKQFNKKKRKVPISVYQKFLAIKHSFISYKKANNV